jgi:membrane protein YqaA with SNARE-associated domain
MRLIIVFLIAFGFNLIPFAGPSNMFIAAWATIIAGLGNADSTLLLIIGIIVALGATLAKGIHYRATFFISKHFTEKKFGKFEANAVRVKKWAFLMLFLAAATPIPDEPIVITLGLMKYNITKFFTSYFLGKLSIAVLGAFAGNAMSSVASAWLSPIMMIILMAIMSAVLTIIMVVIMFKVDLDKLTYRLMGKKSDHDDTKVKEKIN